MSVTGAPPWAGGDWLLPGGSLGVVEAGVSVGFVAGGAVAEVGSVVVSVVTSVTASGAFGAVAGAGVVAAVELAASSAALLAASAALILETVAPALAVGATAWRAARSASLRARWTVGTIRRSRAGGEPGGSGALRWIARSRSRRTRGSPAARRDGRGCGCAGLRRRRRRSRSQRLRARLRPSSRARPRRPSSCRPRLAPPPAARGGRLRPRRRSRRRRRRVAPPARGRAELGEQQPFEQQQRADGHDRGERVVVGLQVLLGSRGSVRTRAAWRRAGVLSLTRPSATSPSSRRTSSQLSLRASAASASAMRARTSSDLTDGTVVSIACGDLVVGEGVDLAQQQRGALRLGQCVDVGDQLAEALAREDLLAGRGCRCRRSACPSSRRRSREARRRWLSERLRAIRYSHGSHVDLALVGEDRVERGREDLLEDVLGVLARAEHVPAEGEQPRLVARAEVSNAACCPRRVSATSRSSDCRRSSGDGPPMPRLVLWMSLMGERPPRDRGIC